MTVETISVADGKYELTNDNGVMTAKRHGEPWSRDLVGDNLVYWMFVRIRELEAQLAAPQPAQEAAGRLHVDGYFTWKEGRCPPGYERDKLLPCDFYLAAPTQAAGRPLREGEVMGAYMDFDRTADKTWSSAEYLTRFGMFISQRTAGAASPQPAQEPATRQVTDEMVSRFLGWKLPPDFSPDCGISFKRTHSETSPWGPQKYEPTGTNLLMADQARAMLEYVLAGAPTQAAQAEPSERTVASISDEELVLRALQHAVMHRPRRKEFAWAAVSEAFALGSTFSQQLLRRFGFDPDSGKKV